MATLAIAHTGSDVRRSPSATLAIFVKETKYEFLKLLRTRSFSLAIIGLPVMFYTLFGLMNRGATSEGQDMVKYLLAGYACFGLVGAALFGIGVGLGTERGAGWLELKRASPMPPMAYLVAKCITAQAFGVIILAVLVGIATAFGGVRLSLTEAAMMIGMALVGTLPFAALGLVLALIVPPNAAPGIINLIYLPMSFMSGLWIPLKFLPHWLRPIAPMTPTYHLSQLMLTIFGYQVRGSNTAGHWAGLAGFTLLALGVGWAIFHRAEQDA